MNIAEIMTRNPITVRRGASLDSAMELLDEHDIRHLPVVDDAVLVGVVSDRDVLDATGWLSPRQREVLEAPEAKVADIMRGAPATVGPDEPINNALGLMVQARIGCVPVVQDGALQGIVTEMDILRAYAEASRREGFHVEEEPAVDVHMSRDPATVGIDASGDEVAALLSDKAIRHLPVLDGERLVGIVSDRDFRKLRGQGQLELTQTRDFMTPEPLVAQVGESLSSVALVLSSSRISALPVMDGERLVGLTTTIDVMIPCALALQRS